LESPSSSWRNWVWKNQSCRADKISSENLNTKKNGWFAASTILYIIPQYARTTAQNKEHKYLQDNTQIQTPYHQKQITQFVFSQLQSWTGAIKEFEFDHNIDYTELIDNKALAPLRSKIQTAYNPERLGCNPDKPSTSRRVLEKSLNRPTVNVKVVCEKVQTRSIPDKWKIIMIHAKQREFSLPECLPWWYLKRECTFV
jgi:hypothetical protein